MNSLVKECHANSIRKGFWSVNPNVYETPAKLMLIVSELGEAMEADRINDTEGLTEEIADVFIRLFDLCGRLGIDIDAAVAAKMKKNADRPPLHNKRY